MSAPPVTILFVPWTQIGALFGPHLAPAQLAAHLQNCGIVCRVLDLNVRFLRWLARPGGLLDERLEFRKQQLVDEDGPIHASRLERAREAMCGLVHTPVELLWEERGGADGPARDSQALWFAHRTPQMSAWGFGYQLAPDGAPAEGLLGSVPEVIDRLAYQSLFDEYLDTDECRELLAQVGQSGLVGINVSFSIQLACALRVARRVRAQQARPLIILGGTQPSLMSVRDRERVAALPFIDGLALFEGERTITQLAALDSDRRGLQAIANLVYRDGETVRRTEMAAPVPPDELCTPAYSDIDLPLYPPHAMLSVFVSSGCYWDRCTFCEDRQAYGPARRRYNARSAAKVVADIGALAARHRAQSFALITDAAHPTWCQEFSSRLCRAPWRPQIWSFLRNEPEGTFTPELVGQMAEAGFREVTFGVETFSNRLLGLMNKGTTRRHRIDNIRAFAAAGIEVCINVIPDFPTTTTAEAVDTLRRVLELRDCITRLNTHRFRLCALADIAERPHDFGLHVTCGDESFFPFETGPTVQFSRTQGASQAKRELLLAAFDSLENELRIYHATRSNRERIAALGFTWEEALFSFRRCALLPAHFSIARAQELPTDYLIVPDVASYLEMQPELRPLTTQLVSRPGAPVTFAHVAEVVRGALPSRATSNQARRDAIDLLTVFVHCGVVERIFGGSRFRSSAAVSQVCKPRRTRQARRVRGQGRAGAHRQRSAQR